MIKPADVGELARAAHVPQRQARDAAPAVRHESLKHFPAAVGIDAGVRLDGGHVVVLEHDAGLLQFGDLALDVPASPRDRGNTLIACSGNSDCTRSRC